MDTLEIVVIAVVVVLGVLALGGARAARRRRDANERDFRQRIDQANRDLAAAHAADRGWEPARLEAAARAAFAEQHPASEIEELALMQVVDPPGTDDDRAVWRVQSHGHAHRLTLGRRGDDWIFETLE
jgi:anti-sigma-K factor RskA